MIVRRIDDETLLNLIARFPSGRHPNIHAALHELAERREAAGVKLPKVRELIEGMARMYRGLDGERIAVAALAELDAVEKG